MKIRIKIKLILASTLLSSSVFASGELHLDHANTNISDTASLQNGAKLFMNYCSGCHAISFMRYNRIAKDLNLSDSLVAQHLMFAGEKPGETITTAMPEEGAAKDMVMPDNFYSTTNNPTQIFLNNKWNNVGNTMMDKCIVVKAEKAMCVPIRQIKKDN